MSTTEARELSLVGKVELKIALASSDKALDALLKTYLPPLLLKLESEHASVRNKVISICQHLKTRLETPSIQLPVQALLSQYKAHSDHLVRHFDLLYIQQGVTRLSEIDQLELLPVVIDKYDHDLRHSTKNAAILFHLLLRLLRTVKFPERGSADDLDLRSRFRLEGSTEDAKALAECIGHLLLLVPSKTADKRSPGLNSQQYNFLNLNGKDDTWTNIDPGAPNLVEAKILALKFIASGAFTDQERFLPSLFASADTNSWISDIGEDLMKRILPTIPLEDEVLVKKLFLFYLGTDGPDGILPTRPPLQMKILRLLCRSRTAISFTIESLKIVERGLGEPALTDNPSESLRVSKGHEAAKLRTQVFAYINWLARMGSKSDLTDFAPETIGLVRQFIEGQGWPRPRSDEPLNLNDLQSRSSGYESIGTLAAACPENVLVEPNLELLRWLMTSLSEDPCGGETSLSIDHALSSLVASLAGQEKTLGGALTHLVLYNMNLTVSEGAEAGNGVVRSTRFISLKFANRCLPFDNVDARYMDVLALCSSGKERNELLDEGRKGLHPYWHRIMNPGVSLLVTDLESSAFNLPAFPSIAQRLLSPGAEWNLNLPNMTGALNAAISFCRCVLMQTALEATGDPPKIDADWEKNIDAVLQNTMSSRGNLRRILSEWTSHDEIFARALRVYVFRAFELLTTRGSIDGAVGATQIVEILSILDVGSYTDLFNDLSRLQTPLFSTRKDLRMTAAHAYGLLRSSKPTLSSTLDSTIKQRLKAWEQAIGSGVYEIHGCILAHAFFLSRSARRDCRDDKMRQEWSAFQELLSAILRESKDDLLIEAVFSAFSQLALYAAPSSTFALTFSEQLLQALLKNVKKGSETGILALGRIAMQFGENVDPGASSEPRLAKDSPLGESLETLYGLHDIRRPETHFAVGEALSCAAIAWDASVLKGSSDIEGPQPLTAPRDKALGIILNKVLTDCKSTKPALRQATVIWLLCLVQFCGHHDVIQSQLQRCQTAFKGFLTDRDAFNQETASRGLTLVYEKGDKSLKDDLVRDLVNSFMGTNTNLGGTVSEDTELFDAGTLPTGDGSIRTYKDIMSLASEVGDSSLVYRFMTLASHDAIWSSRAAFGRFGLSNILSEAGSEESLVHNPKLYPALFRYRFDPNTGVRNAMNDIWTALVKDPAATINKYFDPIIRELFKNILGKEWRTRQACCGALADLLQGRQFETYEPYLIETWSLTFKVCDDIKDSVRTAAMSLARVLVGILIRALEGADTSKQTADAMLKQVLPFLLSTQGLESSAADVQAFARKTVLEIIKKGQSRTLRPFVPNLVEKLLLLLSSIEPEMINYLHINAEQFGTTKQEVDDARLKYIRGSSLLESIEKCLDYLDADSMPNFEPHLQNAIKSSLGLPSKVGCSRVLVSLSTRQNFIFRPYADTFLNLALKQIFDRNDTISSAFAASCGYLARLATDSALESFIDSTQSLYFESEDDRQRTISGDLMHAFSKHATDRFNSFASKVYPFIFTSKHDKSSGARSLFQDTWNENVGGSRAVLLYLKEIVALADKNLNSPRWSIKHTAAFSIADAVTNAGSNISDADTNTLWPTLEKALAGKTWDGKETVFEALVTFTQHSSLARRDPTIAAQIRKIFVREMKRNNPEYRHHAFSHAPKFIKAFETVDLFGEVADIIEPMIEELCGEDDDDAMDVDATRSGGSSGAAGPSSKTVKDLTLSYGITAVFTAAATHPGTLDATAWQTRLSRCLQLVRNVQRPETRTLGIQLAVYDGLALLFRKLPALHAGSPDALQDLLAQYGHIVFAVENEVEQVRNKAAQAAEGFARVVVGLKGLKGMLEGNVRQWRERERAPGVKRELEKVAKVLG